ncbi:MAG: hypothetical protein F6J92_07135 [Symploca sp. SIO1A3]|nr:hypothetical protein [Symploca sp. SIO1A3]
MESQQSQHHPSHQSHSGDILATLFFLMGALHLYSFRRSQLARRTAN